MVRISSLVGQHVLIKILLVVGYVYEVGEVYEIDGVFFVSNLKIEYDAELTPDTFEDCDPPEGFVLDGFAASITIPKRGENG